MKNLIKIISLNFFKKILLTPIILKSNNKIKSFKKGLYQKTFGFFSLFMGGLLVFATCIIITLKMIVPEIQTFANFSSLQATVTVLLALALVFSLVGYFAVRSHLFKGNTEVKPKKKNILSVALGPFIKEMSKERKKSLR